ncbi:aminodeoxychorismate lyase [sulfur-oxidizing endosymbiont of Gigantopelta aegis]|uniref:aminodeoxychorismate lyase n=1 Tax=sulfur-oxidizing endosymbiont of Gigantopelta aegis TaxID=2794934 RepID=UPI0018DD3B3E|nr:aminodeoxychorismate lyase [sulfur-oxidizing endosymbiont of Gigantopelta aegis]
MTQLEHNLDKTLANVAVNDRGLAYGDGLFETIAFVNEQLHHWALHWQRLVLGCERLAIKPPDEAFLLAQINLKMTQDKLDSGSPERVVKIILTRGIGGRGYQFPECNKPSLIIQILPWPERPLQHYQAGIDALVARTCLAKQPALAGIKHLNRLEQVLARNEFSDDKFQEGLMLECSDHDSLLTRFMIEGIASNLFFVIEGQLMTPKIANSGVQGTMRQAILLLAAKSSITIEEADYPLEILKQASEVFFCNSLSGIIPMASLRVDEQTRWTFNKNQRIVVAQLSKHINKELNRPEISAC